MNSNKNIFLIGYMGVGKSTIAKYISNNTRYKHLDLDDYIEEKEGISISEIFETRGESYFREIESQSLKEITRNSHQIIATGGGTPCFNSNLDFMIQHGHVIYLQCSIEKIYARLSNEIEKRPLLHAMPEKERLGSMKRLFKQRRSTYNQAPIKIRDHGGVDSISKRIIKQLKL